MIRRETFGFALNALVDTWKNAASSEGLPPGGIFPPEAMTMYPGRSSLGLPGSLSDFILI